MSEANKDEAVKCLNIARKALYDLESIPGGVNSAAGKGCLSKARRFTEKANRLGGDSVKDQVNQVLAEIEQRRSGGASGSGRGRRGDSPSTSTQSQQDLRRRTGKRASASTSSSSQKADSGTPEQRALVKRINGCKDYYQILGIQDKKCSEDVIKRSYKKLALKLHPDKCKVNGAEDAFKAVSRSFSCLSDPQKRKSYDRFGSEQPSMGGGGGGAAGAHHFYRGGTQEIDPEELFNMFFGGSPMFNHMYTRSGGRHRQRSSNHRGNGEPASFNVSGIIQLLPVLFLIIFTLFGSSSNDPVYSLRISGKYNARETTSMRGIDYYVKSHSNFAREYPQGTYARRRVDTAVERDYRQHLENECWRERLRRNQVGGHRVKMKSCTELRDIWG